MSSVAEQHVIYQIANAPLREHPYPHTYVESVFPEDLYAEMRRYWPDSSSLVSLASTGRVSKGAYPERFILPMTEEAIGSLPPDRRRFWTDFSEWFLGPRLLDAVMRRFEQHVINRFREGLDDVRFGVDALVVRDLTNYSIGPHTDAPHRLLSLLFYCPDNGSRSHLGTSLYVPNNPDFRCEGGPHYPFAGFTRVKTMEYRPNTLFAFFKTDRSFHGVAPIADASVQRDVLLYDIRVFTAAPQADKEKASSAGSGMLKKILRLNR